MLVQESLFITKFRKELHSCGLWHLALSTYLILFYSNKCNQFVLCSVAGVTEGAQCLRQIKQSTGTKV